jgi:hypothetical protein
MTMEKRLSHGDSLSAFTTCIPTGYLRALPGLQLVLCFSETDDKHSYEVEYEEQEKPKSPGFPECFGGADRNDDRDDEVDDWDQIQDHPPSRLSRDLAPDDDVVDGNDRRPTRFSSLYKHLPTRDDHQRIQDNESDPVTGGIVIFHCALLR